MSAIRRPQTPWVLTLVLALGAASQALGSTYTVLNTSDSGPGSLRQAILDSNASGTASLIQFTIPGGGVHTITPVAALPKLIKPVTIDGYTQPGASANTNPPDQGLNTVLQIEIDCTSGGTYCLQVGSDDVTIRGLVFHSASVGTYGIATDFFKKVQNLVVEGCFFGTTPDGLSPQPLTTGVILGQHLNARIGGTSAASRNLFAADSGDYQLQISNAANAGSSILGNLFCTDKTGLQPMTITAAVGREGVLLAGGPSAGNTSQITVGGLTPAAGNVFVCTSTGIRLTNMTQVQVQGNRFGTDPGGTRAIGQGLGTALYVDGGDPTVVIGGTAAGAGNVIAASFIGIAAASGTNAVIRGNFIGTDATETLDLGNDRLGIDLHATGGFTVGGVGPGERNAILFNHAGGVTVECCSNGNLLRGNRITANLGMNNAFPSLGIDLQTSSGGLGPNPNDPGDPDTGGNDGQNFPLLTSAAPEGGGTRVIGTLDSTPSSPFTLDFYADPVCRARPRSQAQADQYLGSMPVSTNASGIASFSFLLPTPIAAGQPVTATATAANGSTSELSPEIVFSSVPIAGSPAGGTTLSIKGMLFVPGATVTVAGLPATNVTVSSATQIFADAPALPVGSIGDIVVTLPGGITGRLRDGYVSRFNDVTGPIDPFVAALGANRITAGCGSGNYCSNSSVTRAQMAVFLLRSKRGACYVPPPATGTVFNDVPANGFAASYIEALAAGGVTGGCGGGAYCPSDSVTRAQMAVFLLRMLEGSSYFPKACSTATFSDVPCSSGFSRWIYELVRRSITAGCGGGKYCPDNAVTRGQMAVFLVTTFGLP